MKKDVVLTWLCIFLFVVSFIGWVGFFKDNENTTIETRTVCATFIRFTTFDDNSEIFITVREDGNERTVTWSNRNSAALGKSNAKEVLEMLAHNVGKRLEFKTFGVDNTDPYVKKGVNILNVSIP